MQEGGSHCTPKSSAKSEQIASLLVHTKLCFTRTNNQDAVSYLPHAKGGSETRRQGNFSSTGDQQRLTAGGGCKGRHTVPSSWTSRRMELAHFVRQIFFVLGAIQLLKESPSPPYKCSGMKMYLEETKRNS